MQLFGFNLNTTGVDYFGYQFWSNDYTIPGTLSDVLTITHQDVTVTVNQIYGVDIDPLEGVNVYLFTGAGSYQGINQATDANGQVIFNVPEQDYKVRPDYLSRQYWSDVFFWQDIGDLRWAIYIEALSDDILLLTA